MWPKPKKKGKTKNKLNAIEPEKIPDGPEQIELLRKSTGTSSGVHQGREANAQPREDISGVWKASLMKAISPGAASQVSTDSIPKMKIPVNRDVLEAQEKQRRQAVFQFVIRIIDRMFDNFQNTAYGFNQVASGSDLELTWMRPQVREENMAAWHEGRSRLCQIFSGRISTRFWTMLVRGTDEGIGVYIMPADKVLSFTPEDRNFLCYLTMSPNFDQDRNFTQFLANGLPVAEDLYPSIFRALLDALIRYANEEAAPGEVFNFGEIGIVPEAPPPPKEVKEAAVSSSFNAEVPRTSYADAVQQIQAHNKAGHVDQLISTSTNARPVDPNQFNLGNSGNFQGLQPGAEANPVVNPSASDEWKGFSSPAVQKQFQTGSQPALQQSQSGNWRTPQGQPVPEPITPFNAQDESGGSGAWNFIPNKEIQSHQQNSGSQQILPNFQHPQTQQNQQFQQQQPQPQQPYRHPLEQQQQPPQIQIPPQSLMSHPMADSGMISEFTMPDFQRPSRAELEQLRQDARPPINQSQELAGVSPVFKVPDQSAAQIMEQEQFELLSENPPEVSGDFAPITVTHNYESTESEEIEESGEFIESTDLSDENQEDEFEAISESQEEMAEEFSSQEDEEQIEEQVEESVENFDSGEEESSQVEENLESEEEFDSGESEIEELEDSETVEEVEEVEEAEESEEVEDSLEESEHTLEEEHLEEDESLSDDSAKAEEAEEIEAEVEDSDDADAKDEKSEEADAEADEEDDDEEEDEEDEDEDDKADSIDDSNEESNEVSDEESEEDVDSQESEDSEKSDEVDADSDDAENNSDVDADSSKTSSSEENSDESDESDESDTEESNDSDEKVEDQDLEKSKSDRASSFESTSDIGSRSAGRDAAVMPAFSKFPSLPIVEITLGKCPDLSDALSVLLPVLDAQIDELAAQGGKAFTTKDFKRAEAIIKLTEKLEDFKTEASSILNLIDDDEDDEED